MIKVFASIYTYTSIVYTALAFIFRSTIIWGVNKLNKLNQYVAGNTDISYSLKYYFTALLIFLFFVAVTSTHLAESFLILSALLIIPPSILFLHVASKSWGYVWSDRIEERYKFREDYQVILNIICLSMILPALFFGAMISSQLVHVILVYLFIMTRLTYLDEYEMSAHDCMHKPILKKRKNDTFATKSLIKIAYLWFNYVLGLLFIYPPHFYFYHHMYNHHKENCGPNDVTSIIFYHRNSISDFCRASLKFSIGWATGIDLIYYLLKRKKFRAAGNLTMGILYFYIIIYLISLVSPFFAVCLLIQHAVDGFMMAITIWRWHGFSDPHDPQNSFKNTTNIVFESSYIYAYHTAHHEKPAMHYALVDDFLWKNNGRIINEKMLLLANIGTMDLVSLILTGQINIIAQYTVNLTNKITQKEIIYLLKSRLIPSPSHAATPCYCKKHLDAFLKNIFLRYNKVKFRDLDKSQYSLYDS